jgi:hypothetical protein
MWKLPMFGCSDGTQVLKEIDACQKAFPNAYVRLVAFDASRQVQVAGERCAAGAASPDRRPVMLQLEPARMHVIVPTLRLTCLCPFLLGLQASWSTAPATPRSGASPPSAPWPKQPRRRLFPAQKGRAMEASGA